MSVNGLTNSLLPNTGATSRPGATRPNPNADRAAANVQARAAQMAALKPQTPIAGQAAAQHAVPAEAPAGTDPMLWSVLTTDERTFFAKTAALEQPERQWLRLQLWDGASEASLPWQQIRRLAASEPALAWDGAQLWRQRLRPLLPERFRLATGQDGLLESLAPVASQPQALAPGELELAVGSLASHVISRAELCVPLPGCAGLVVPP